MWPIDDRACQAPFTSAALRDSLAIFAPLVVMTFGHQRTAMLQPEGSENAKDNVPARTVVHLHWRSARQRRMRRPARVCSQDLLGGIGGPRQRRKNHTGRA